MAVVQPVDAAAAAGVGHDLALGAARQQHVGRLVREVIGQRLAVFGVRVAVQPQRLGRRVRADRLQHLDDRVRGIAQPDHGALVEQRRQGRRQHVDRQHRQRAWIGIAAARLREPSRGFVDRRARRDPQGLEQHDAGDALIELARSMHQHRDTLPREQQRQQRYQIGLLARAVVARDDHHLTLRRRQRQAVRMRGLQHAGQLVRRLALDPVRHQHGAEFEVGDASGQHCIEQQARIVARQRTGAGDAAANFLDIGGRREGGRSGEAVSGHGGAVMLYGESGAAGVQQGRNRGTYRPMIARYARRPARRPASAIQALIAKPSA